jgi:L-alanine-DL-glutamate epimerase-like enolase superfamily enzyme
MWADANGAYSTKDALRLIHAIRDINVPFALEQPCKTYEENLFIRKK